MAKVTPWVFAEKLVKAGVFTQSEMNKIRRIVIDIHHDRIPTMYIERYASSEVLDVITTLDGIRIAGVDEDGITIVDQRKRDEEGHMVYLRSGLPFPDLCHCTKNEAHTAVEL